jgi:hypothetical protein
MKKAISLAGAAIALGAGISPAAAQSALGLSNNDSVYIDGNTFKIVPGKAKGDASALIQNLDARALGAGAIIFRADGKLYIAEAAAPSRSTSDQPARRPQYMGDDPQYMRDPSQTARRPQYMGDDPQYMRDPSQTARRPQYMGDDPQYMRDAQDKLWKAFNDGWTPSVTK